jgi:hypothetical protein
MNHRVLSKYLKTIPSCLGGNCTCEICSDIHVRQQPRSSINEIDMARPYFSDGEDLPSPRQTSQADIHVSDNWNHLLRTLVIGILMVWIVIALIAGIYDPESRPF